MTSANLYIYTDEAHTALDIFLFAAFFFRKTGKNRAKPSQTNLEYEDDLKYENTSNMKTTRNMKTASKMKTTSKMKITSKMKTT